MFYGTHFIMSPPAKSKLKRQSQLLSSVLSRTLSYKYRELDSTFCSLGASDDPAELSTQLSAPGVLKVFGDSVCTGTHYKSVLATGTSSAQELVKEALERYALDPACASQYVLCDVVGRAGSPGRPWQAQCFRVFGDNEKPLLIQELWKPREGLSRRFELRKRSDVEELAAKDVDTITAGINAQARRLQRVRAKGTPAVAPGAARSSPPPRLRRTVSETSLNLATTLSGAAQGPEEPSQDTMRDCLYQSPHLLLLQGYSQQHDSLVYVLNRERHTVGQRTPSSKPSISLSAPDILPLHCTLRRYQPPEGQAALLLEPIPGAPISVNFKEVGWSTVALQHGDLLSLGLYYLLLFKDPSQARTLPTGTLARLRAAPQNCRMCGMALGAGDNASSVLAAIPRRRQLLLEFEPEEEDALLQRVMTLIEPGGDDYKLTPAFLLCLCVQHSATHFEPGTFGQLLLKIAKRIREAVWEKTKELAEKQAQLQEPISWASFTMADLLPDLQHILFWMANSIELLYFMQQKCPLYVQSMEEELDITGELGGHAALTGRVWSWGTVGCGNRVESRQSFLNSSWHVGTASGPSACGLVNLKPLDAQCMTPLAPPSHGLSNGGILARPCSVRLGGGAHRSPGLRGGWRWPGRWPPWKQPGRRAELSRSGTRYQGDVGPEPCGGGPGVVPHSFALR
ncbi:Hypothetical predicted protein [Marmota monax]|uniref:Ras-associating domain-containing protein n=1 Tax=Marmota monax TaxID=9995 RepID=A0A5E4C753_MARMO|nr:hypothetical protein GHT09_011046 [Marmota monax]VTJ77536.1 Hypothetical predicted protein [Marmota monax]